MRGFLLGIILLQIVGGQWIALEVFDYKTGVRFSPIPGDETVTSTYTIYILEESVPVSLDKVKSFKLEITLKSGYTITRVLDEWEFTRVEIGEGEERLSAVELTVVVEGWDNWDLEIFKVEAWMKLK